MGNDTISKKQKFLAESALNLLKCIILFFFGRRVYKFLAKLLDKLHRTLVSQKSIIQKHRKNHYLMIKTAQNLLVILNSPGVLVFLSLLNDEMNIVVDHTSTIKPNKMPSNYSMYFFECVLSWVNNEFLCP